MQATAEHVHALQPPDHFSLSMPTKIRKRAPSCRPDQVFLHLVNIHASNAAVGTVKRVV